MLLTAWQIGAIVARVTGRRGAALLAASIFLSVPAVPLVASWSYAEAPLWLMLTCAFGRLVQWQRSRSAPSVIVAGVFAAAAAYVKNEGLFFALVALICLALLAGRKRWKHTLAYAAVLLALYLPWLLWTKLALGATSHAVRNLSVSPGQLHYALGRIIPSLAAAGKTWLDLRQWNVVLAGVLVGSLLVLLRGPRESRRLLAIPLLTLGGTFVIMVCHWAEVNWLFQTAWNRMTLQALPMLIIVVAVAALRPRAASDIHAASGSSNAPAGAGE